MSYSQKLTWFNNARKNYGLVKALKATSEFIGIKSYISVTLPYVDRQVSVRADTQWLKLEKKALEPDCLRQLIAHVRKGMVAFDVGCHYGEYTFILSELVGKSGKVVCFEPSFVSYKVLRENMERNKIRNVTTENLAVSNSLADATLFNPINLQGSGSSIVMHGESEVSVHCTTIDNYCQKNNIKPDFLKVDVEGAEALVIEGAKKTLHKTHPLVLLEFHIYEPAQLPKNWATIVEDAKSVIFVDGQENKYGCGDAISTLPKGSFHALLQY